MDRLAEAEILSAKRHAPRARAPRHLRSRVFHGFAPLEKAGLRDDSVGVIRVNPWIRSEF